VLRLEKTGVTPTKSRNNEQQHIYIAPTSSAITQVKPLKPKRKYKRGYPVAILTGLDANTPVLWKIYSHIAKHEKTVPLSEQRSNPKALYNYHEAIINALRPTLKEGVRSIILASPPRTSYAQELINHVREHHTWLTQGPNKASFSEITGSATTLPQVAALTRTQTFRDLISQTTEEETENLINLLEQRLNTSNHMSAVLFSLEEAEALILNRQKTGKPEPEYLLLTDKYLSDSRQKNRLQRLMQIAANKGVKTRIVNAETPAGKRLTQFGGLVCLAKPT
jgi:stalled ribosome rescue protein Dom34